jgi:hypothetical protein
MLPAPPLPGNWVFLKPESTFFIYRIHSVDKDAGKRQERHQWLSPLGGPDHIQLCEFTAGSYSWVSYNDRFHDQWQGPDC